MADVLEVARFDNLAEAELVASLLRSHGIDATLPDRHHVTAAGPLAQRSFGGIRVVAPEHQIREARDLAARARRGEFAASAEEDDGWMAEATPGKVGELDDSEIHGALTGMKGMVRVVLIGMLVLSAAGCLMTVVFAGG